MISTSGEAYAEWGYEVATFEVDDTHPIAIRSADGLAPRFQVLWPSELDAGREYPVLLHLHGGAMDVDDAETVAGRCSEGLAFGSEITSGMMEDSGLAYLAAREGWIVVAPENSFCDGWVGEGPEDDTDPGHGGYALSQIAIDYLRYGREDVGVSGVFAGGVSLGGMGAVYFAHQYPDVAAVMTDCSPSDIVRYFYEEGYSPVSKETLQSRYRHAFGADPYTDKALTEVSSAWPRYRALSMMQSITEESLRLPLLHLFSSEDGTSPLIQHDEVRDALEKHYDPAGIRWLEYDVAHDRPGHTQVNQVSALYTAWTVLRFFEESTVEILEAEGSSSAEWVGAVVSDVGSRSGASVRRAGLADGAGVLYSETLPDIDAGATVRAAFFVLPDGPGDPTADAITLSILEDGAEVASTTLSVSELAASEYSGPEMIKGLDAAQLSAISSGGELSVSVSVTGSAQLDLDVIIVDWL